MAKWIGISFCLLLAFQGQAFAAEEILFPEVETNDPSIFPQFDKKNEQTLDRLQPLPGFDSIRKQIAARIDQSRADSKLKSVSFTDTYAYNFYRDDKNPKGIYRRVDKAVFKKLKAEDKLDQVPWKNVMDLDQFIASHQFPAEVSEPSVGGFECLRDKDTRELKRCLVGFSQSGGDRNVYYEFDFNTLSWLTQDGFKYEILGRTSFSWVDEDNLIVFLDGLTYYNHAHPNQKIDMDQAVKQGLITPAGYPRTALSWKRGDAFDSKKEIFKASELAQYAWVGTVELEDLPKDQVLLGWENRDSKTAILSLGVKQKNGAYVWNEFDFPKDLDKNSFIAGEGNHIRVYLKTKESTFKGMDSKTLFSIDIEISEDGSLKQGQPVAIYKVSDTEGVLESTSVIENEEYDLSDDQIILVISKNVSTSAYLLKQERGGWKKSAFQDPLNLKYKSMSVWQDKEDESLHMSVSNFLNPSHEYILKSKEEGFDYELIEKSRVLFDSSPYAVEQLWVDRGRDQNGKHIKVPYYVVYNPQKVALENNQNPAPTLIYAYGGFSVGMNPYYLGQTGKLWLDKGGVYVLANIRGGDEFGAYWHQSALKANRANTYGDFFAVSEDIIRRGISSPEKLAIEGGSNGGLLTGVAVTQRPDLYQAAVIAVPLLDMMRYHKLYVGASWMTEYGDPDGDEHDFWSKYSPLHQLKAGVEYPKVFVTTNRYDDRVHPAHARKFSLRMDELGIDHYFYEDPKGGHGGDTLSSYEQALSSTIKFMYLYSELGMLRGQ
ncbi:MAG: S9 family peptidase [Bdellovibrionales bacterium]|nr:S9 family peptidase [Bdellovibrionales bacterium]